MADPAETRSRSTRRTDTSDPRASRARALKILFQADIRGVPGDETLAALDADAAARAILDDSDAEDFADTASPPGTPHDTEHPTDASRSVDAEVARAAAARAADAGPAPRTSAARTADAARVPAIDGFTRILVLGVGRNLPELDALIGRYARRWQISRMPVLDRTVLRLATQELLHETTPPAVVIDEAVTLAKSLSTDDSGRYVNGVLESIRKDIARQRASGTAAVPEPATRPEPDPTGDPASG